MPSDVLQVHQALPTKLTSQEALPLLVPKACKATEPRDNLHKASANQVEMVP